MFRLLQLRRSGCQVSATLFCALLIWVVLVRGSPFSARQRGFASLSRILRQSSVYEATHRTNDLDLLVLLLAMLLGTLLPYVKDKLQVVRDDASGIVLGQTNRQLLQLPLLPIALIYELLVITGNHLLLPCVFQFLLKVLSLLAFIALLHAHLSLTQFNWALYGKFLSLLSQEGLSELDGVLEQLEHSFDLGRLLRLVKLPHSELLKLSFKGICWIFVNLIGIAA